MEKIKFTTNRFAPKLHIKKGDNVVITAGSNKGQKGVVKEILIDQNRAIVEGLNMVKKHLKPTNDNAGGIVEVEAPIHLSNMAVADPKSGMPTRTGRKSVDGKSVRYSKKSGEIIK